MPLRIQLRIRSLFPPISAVNLKLPLRLDLAGTTIGRIQPTSIFAGEACRGSFNDRLVAPWY